jgi:hypothetical protein
VVLNCVPEVPGEAGAIIGVGGAGIGIFMLEKAMYMIPPAIPIRLARTLIAPRVMLKIPTAVKIPGRPGPATA